MPIPQATGVQTPGTAGAQSAGWLGRQEDKPLSEPHRRGRSATHADNLDTGRDSACKRRSHARCISRTCRPRYHKWGIRQYSPVIRGGHLI